MGAPESATMLNALIFDVDGTLVDNNGLHALAWERAFRLAGYDLTADEIFPHIGKGGDMLVPSLIGFDKDRIDGDEIRDFHTAEFKSMIASVRAFPGVPELMHELNDKGVKIALASSAKKSELERYITMISNGAKIDVIVSGDDVRKTKPAPDIFSLALDRLKTKREKSAVVGDSAWDVIAADRLGVRSIILLSGGNESALNACAPAKIYKDPRDLLAHLGEVLELG